MTAVLTATDSERAEAAVHEAAISASGRERLAKILDRLVNLAVEDYYNPYKEFQWPESLPEDRWWMSPELMTVHGTRFADQLDERQLQALSKWESISFYSLNVHGIRELLLEVTRRIHQPGFEQESEFFHIFLGEENEHMWFFATFCLKYGKKIYPSKRLHWSIEEVEPDIESFLVFSRILILEEVVDYFNYRLGKDESLDPIIRKVNSIHHQDESRHIAFGREIVRELYRQIRGRYPQSRLDELSTYLSRYITANIRSLYNPAVYRDAGLDDAFGVRTELLESPARKEAHRKILKRTTDFFANTGILRPEEIEL